MEITPMTDTTRLALHWIVDIFEEENIPYQIVGGTAAHFYGASRPINDIDIDVGEKHFARLLERVKGYVTFGPEVLIDSEWIVLVLGVTYHGQLIELSNADAQKLYDDETSEWKDFSYTLQDVVQIPWEGKQLRLLDPQLMIDYKRYLHGQKQKDDIETIREFIAETKKAA